MQKCEQAERRDGWLVCLLALFGPRGASPGALPRTPGYLGTDETGGVTWAVGPQRAVGQVRAGGVVWPRWGIDNCRE
jgi:hypothetical protein